MQAHRHSLAIELLEAALLGATLARLLVVRGFSFGVGGADAVGAVLVAAVGRALRADLVAVGPARKFVMLFFLISV